MRLIIISILCFICFCPLAFAESPEEIKSQMNQLMEEHKNTPSFSLVGEVKSGRSAAYSINGVDFSLSKDVLVTGDFRIGKTAKVRGEIKNGRKVAKSISVSEDRYNSAPSSEEAAM